MKLKNIMGTLAFAAVAALPATMQAQSGDARMDKFIDGLMGKMTLEEKLGQLNLPVTGDIVTGQAKSSDVAGKIRSGQVGGLFNLKGVDKIREVQKIAVEQSRLKIPLLFGMDVIHGYETVFPIPLALSMSWDMDAIERSARVAAVEASADGICWTFSPMVDICRDARWGRMSEGNGEDPYLGSRIAEAMVRGYQGTNLADPSTVMACVKHFALYGGAEAGRDYNTVDMSRWRMFNYYFPPYKAAAEAGAGSFMTSFNVVDGIPATGNRWLLTDVLRRMWGFKGFVVTDYTAIAEMTAHGMGDLQQVSALALNAGTDMDMVADGFVGTLAQSLREGKVSMESIDAACRRILEAKYKLGLFSDPYRYLDPKRAKTEIYTDAHRAEARRTAAETFVLLKNDGRLLPLQRKGRIALIGPLGNTPANMPGTWSVAADAAKYKSLYQAMKDAVGDKATVTYAKGSNICYDERLEANGSMFGREIRDGRSDKELLDEALRTAAQADVIVAAIGETSEFSGESSSRSDLSLFDAQKDLLTALRQTGKPIVLVNFSGRATVMTWEAENFAAILNVWFGGSEAGDAICDVLFGDKSPSGRLTVSMPKSVGQLPLYYNHLNTGRPLEKGKWFTKFRSNYLDVDNEPLFPFGYGLSYTTFGYGPLSLSNASMTAEGTIRASVTVTNTGNCDADEVVQLYIRDMVGSVSRPVQELRDFRRISLKKGESKTVSFTINAEKLKFYNNELQYVCEPGEFQVMVGPNSRDVQVQSFTLKD
ncbi:beta-glucosidase BglX [Prevotella sp. kh1p2]|uniref:beta-glucosidase BglX n=1 Tax=Prevotella sp. kh1p2 TaxID=1761883 RepID=UPI0008D4A070|nr:beta-glucosidase BglX [Prevotella sp. kh1p2]SES85574.1 beta-glucosidase [Prevotella sp. kh1p2]SNU11046.1 beta-glucosidase [Prevotellaceae bacterium KH2P17]